MKARMALFFATLLLPTILSAQSDGAFLKYRQDIMKSNGLHMGMIGHILKNKLPLTEQVASHAWVISKNMRLLEKAYEKKIIRGKTDSKPEIWSHWSTFVSGANKSSRAAKMLADAAQSGNRWEFAGLIKPLGGTCGGCHKYYRKPKKERFKR